MQHSLHTHGPLHTQPHCQLYTSDTHVLSPTHRVRAHSRHHTPRTIHPGHTRTHGSRLTACAPGSLALSVRYTHTHPLHTLSPGASEHKQFHKYLRTQVRGPIPAPMVPRWGHVLHHRPAHLQPTPEEKPVPGVQSPRAAPRPAPAARTRGLQVPPRRPGRTYPPPEARDPAPWRTGAATPRRAAELLPPLPRRAALPAACALPAAPSGASSSPRAGRPAGARRGPGRGGLCIVLLPAWLRGLGSPRPAWSPRPPSADARAGQGGAGGRGAGRMESGRQGVGGTSPLGAGQRAPVRAGAPPALGDLGQEGQRLGAPASSTERQARGKLKAPWGPWRELSPRCVSCPHSQGSVQSRGQRALRGAGFGFPGPVLQGTKASLRDPVHTCVRPGSQEACSARAARTPAPGASGSAGSRLRL